MFIHGHLIVINDTMTPVWQLNLTTISENRWRHCTFLGFVEIVEYHFAVLPFYHHIRQRWIGMFEKQFIRSAKAWLMMVLLIFDPVFGASAITFCQPTAPSAFTGQLGFVHPKNSLLFRIQHIDNTVMHHVAQFPFELNKAIANILNQSLKPGRNKLNLEAHFLQLNPCRQTFQNNLAIPIQLII